MTRLASKQVAKVMAAPIRVSGLSVATSTSSTTVTTPITTALATAADGSAVPLVVSSSGSAGVVTSGSAARIEIYQATSKDKILAANGEEVYGRLSEAGGVYTLSYFTLPNTGTEAAYVFPAAATIDFEFNYRFEFHQLPQDAIVAIGTRNIAQDAAAAGGSLFGESVAVTATNTLAALTKTPLSQSIVGLTVNSARQEPGWDFTLSGKAITWNAANAGFALATTDRVYVIYATFE